MSNNDNLCNSCEIHVIEIECTACDGEYCLGCNPDHEPCKSIQNEYIENQSKRYI